MPVPLMRHRIDDMPSVLDGRSSGLGKVPFLPAIGKRKPMNKATDQFCNITAYSNQLKMKQLKALLQCMSQISVQQANAQLARASSTSLQHSTKDHKAPHLASLPPDINLSRIAKRHSQCILLGNSMHINCKSMPNMALPAIASNASHPDSRNEHAPMSSMSATCRTAWAADIKM